MIWLNKKSWLTRKHSQSIVTAPNVTHRHPRHLRHHCPLLLHRLLLPIPTRWCLLMPLQRNSNPVVTRAVNVTRRLDGGQNDLHTWHFILQHTTFSHSHTHTHAHSQSRTHSQPLFVCKTLFLSQVLSQLHTHTHAHPHGKGNTHSHPHFQSHTYTPQKKSSHNTLHYPTPHSPSISALGYHWSWEVPFCYLFYCLTGRPLLFLFCLLVWYLIPCTIFLFL